MIVELMTEVRAAVSAGELSGERAVRAVALCRDLQGRAAPLLIADYLVRRLDPEQQRIVVDRVFERHINMTRRRMRKLQGNKRKMAARQLDELQRAKQRASLVMRDGAGFLWRV